MNIQINQTCALENIKRFGYDTENTEWKPAKKFDIVRLLY